ncbi:MAG: peptidylprolyl isomerase [Raineya sp.]|nr:peptidylprolyl isomerase [Raineya sp.]
MKNYLFFGLAFFFSVDVFSQKKEILDKIIAKVDNQIILLSDVELTAMQLLQQNPRLQDNQELRCEILRSMIIGKILVAKAEIDSVMVDNELLDEDFNTRWQQISMGKSDEELKELLGLQNIEAFKSDLRMQLKEKLTIEKMRNHITKNVKITPTEVRRYFNRIPKDSLPVYVTELEIAQIVKNPPLLKAEKERVRSRIEQVYKRIVEEKQSFEEMAKIYSEDGSRDAGGDLDWSKRGNMVPEFEAVVFKLKPGEISKPFESRFGYHIVKLVDRRGDEFHAKHILMMPDWEQVDTQEAERFLDSLRTRILQDSISFEKAALQYSDDKGIGSMNTASNGGRLMASDGSYRIPFNQLDSFLSDLVDNMKVGEISRPHTFRTYDGKKALRIILFRAKHPAHVADFNLDYPKIQQEALEVKKNQKLMEWLQKAKNEVYIEIDREYAPCNILGIN